MGEDPKRNVLGDELIETDSDDSDYDASSGQSDSSFDSDTEKSDLLASNHEEESGDDSSDDSDYEEEEEDMQSSHSEDGSGKTGSESHSSADDDGSVNIGSAPFTGYIFPAVHKLVASGQVEALISYLTEMYAPEQAGPQVWEVSDSLGRNAIHLAVLHNSIPVLRVLLDFDIKNIEERFPAEDKWKYSAIRRKFDDMSLLHIAINRGPWDEATCIEILDVLYSHPAISTVPTTDYWNRTPLHIAVMTGKHQLIRYLVQRDQTWLWSKDSFNMLPIHYAIDTKNASTTELLLQGSLESIDFSEALRSLPSDRNLITHCVAKCSWECLVVVCRLMNEGLPDRAVEVASQLGIEIGGLRDISQNLEAAQKCVLDRSAETALIYDLDCLGHIRLPEEAEDGHGRLKRIKFVVENPNRLEVLVGASGSLKTPEFQNLRTISKVAPCPLNDVVRVHEWSYIKRVIELAESCEPGSMIRLDKGDTNVTSESWSAALKAAGAVVQAMDLVCAEACRNAFVAVRPPGHHVSSRGAVDPNMEDDDTGSNGFCLLNNAAIGAAYAMCVHRHVIKKVAIIDIDIHHGNGTEAIIRGLRQPKTIQIPLNFTGLTGNLEMNSYHPWMDRDDAENVFFSSVHRYDGRFYPQSGQTGVDKNIVNAGLESFSTSADFRYAFSHLVLPRLVEFNPSLIIISAGFDGHVRDRLASGEWDITEEDYYWVTEQLVGVANQCCKGRIVSVLEGGYNTKGGWLSPLAQCVASHVRALSSSWASKWTEPEDSAESSSSEAEESSDGESVVDGIAELLARADAVINETPSEDSPSTKRQRVENEEEAELFGS